MDIDLLSRMVKELILERDKVVLPGLGTFVAEVVPASFSDNGYTINPPYRKLYFRSRLEDDSSLVKLYSTSNNIGEDLAENILTDFLQELRQVLKEKKLVVFPGLGRLRATKENNFFFVPDEDLDIYPEGFGLQPISMKTHVETREEVAQAMENLKSIIDSPAVSASASISAVSENKSVPADEPEDVLPESGETEVHDNAVPADEPEDVLTESGETEVHDNAVPEDEAEDVLPESGETEVYDNAVAEEEAEDVLPESGETEVYGNAVPAEEAEDVLPESEEPEVQENSPAEQDDPVQENTAETESGTDIAAPDETDGPEERQEERQEERPEEPSVKQDPDRSTEKQPAPETAGHGKSVARSLKIVALAVLVIAALLIVFAVLAQIFPGIFDSILYNREQRQILDSICFFTI